MMEAEEKEMAPIPTEAPTTPRAPAGDAVDTRWSRKG